MKDFEIRPPGGVAIQMWKDNSIHFRIGPEQVSLLQASLKVLLKQLSQYAIETIEHDKKSELTRSVLPMNRVQQLESELKRLREEELTIVSGGFESDDGQLGAPPAGI